MLARHISRTRTVAQVMSLSSHPHVHVHVSVSPRLALTFYFTHFLPHSFHFLLHLKIVDYNLLRTPHKESMDLSDEFLLSTKTRQQYCRLESFAMKTDTLMNGSTVKNHISFKRGFGHNATRRTSFRSWFQACQRVRPPVLIIQFQRHLQDRRGLVLHLPHQVIMRLEKQRIELKVIPLQCLCQV